MYCPKCAAQNNDDIKFCRVCGTNLSLINQAITGQLPDPRSTRRRRRGHRNNLPEGPASLAEAIQRLFLGIGFMLVAAGAFFFAPAGKIWWFWMLIPAFALLGKGVADLVAANYAHSQMRNPAQTNMPPARNTGELAPPPAAFDPLAPPSVTEGTTRHLDPTRESYKERR